MLLLSGDYSSASYLQDDIKFVYAFHKERNYFSGGPVCWFTRMLEGSNVSKEDVGVSKDVGRLECIQGGRWVLRMFEESNVSKVGVSKDVGRRLPRG